MTNEEEKILEEILDEENDITLEEAAEEAEDLQEEGRAIEIPIERREDVDLDEILERLVLRGRLRGVPDPTMIQKHLDNFLAMICGATPVDSNVRNSTEYWLDQIAKAFGVPATLPHVEKIWENPDPTASFSQQNVDVDLSPFTSYIVICRYSNSAASAPVPACISLVSEGGNITANGSTAIVYRSYSVIATGLNFSAARERLYSDITTEADNNTRLIPIRIYGIKL